MTKLRHIPRVWNKYIIQFKGKDIGYIQLVDYALGKSTPHLEYSLQEEYRNKGIMSKELRRYLKRRCKDHGTYQMIAIVDYDGVEGLTAAQASESLLDKNNFAQLNWNPLNPRLKAYVTDLRLDKAATMKVMANYRGCKEAKK